MNVAEIVCTTLTIIAVTLICAFITTLIVIIYKRNENKDKSTATIVGLDPVQDTNDSKVSMDTDAIGKIWDRVKVEVLGLPLEELAFIKNKYKRKYYKANLKHQRKLTKFSKLSELDKINYTVKNVRKLSKGLDNITKSPDFNIAVSCKECKQANNGVEN